MSVKPSRRSMAFQNLLKNAHAVLPFSREKFVARLLEIQAETAMNHILIDSTRASAAPSPRASSRLSFASSSSSSFCFSHAYAATYTSRTNGKGDGASRLASQRLAVWSGRSPGKSVSRGLRKMKNRQPS